MPARRRVIKHATQAAALRVGLVLEGVVVCSAPSPQRLQCAVAIDLARQLWSEQGLTGGGK